jgi:hypothetical protein
MTYLTEHWMLASYLATLLASLTLFIFNFWNNGYLDRSDVLVAAFWVLVPGINLLPCIYAFFIGASYALDCIDWSARVWTKKP